jgi:hypothetical protein
MQPNFSQKTNARQKLTGAGGGGGDEAGMVDGKGGLDMK